MKFIKGQVDLFLLLGYERVSLNREGIRYNTTNQEKVNKNIFVKVINLGNSWGYFNEGKRQRNFNNTRVYK